VSDNSGVVLTGLTGLGNTIVGSVLGDDNVIGREVCTCADEKYFG
jgi:hypothetical protein